MMLAAVVSDGSAEARHVRRRAMDGCGDQVAFVLGETRTRSAADPAV
jgi:hypothetical protein